MLKERRAVVQGITDHLALAEDQLDRTISAVAHLNGFLPVARRDAGLAMEVGHQALEASAEAQAMLIRARTALIQAHRALAETQRTYRFPEVAEGGLGSKDPNKAMLPAPLRAVDAA